MEIELRVGDLGTTRDVDAVVSPTNTELRAFAGVNGRLMKLGGPALVEAATALAPLSLGGVVATRAGDLPVQLVLHAAVVGYRPEDLAGPKREGALVSEEVLQLAARRVMATAEWLGCTSVAIPDLGGPSVFPTDEAARVVLGQVMAFTRRSEESRLTKVVVVLPDERARDVYQSALDAEQEAGWPSARASFIPAG